MTSLSTITSGSAENLDAALEYAKQGVRVFPCNRENKAPLVGPDKDANGHDIPGTGGFKKATTDAAQIRSWWTKWPGAMIGMPTGPVSGIDVLDLDLDVEKGKNGLAEIPDWKDRSSVIVRTPRGGVHLYYKSEGTVPNSVENIARGVDTRGNGGYVILPPSRSSKNAYKFEKGSAKDLATLPPFPSDLLGRLTIDRGERTPNENLEADDQDDIAAAIAVIANRDLGWDDWNRIGMAIWNAMRGSEDGFTQFDAFSRKSKKYNERETKNRWDGYHKSPPNRIGAGSIFHWANEANPGWESAYEAAVMLEFDRRANINVDALRGFLSADKLHGKDGSGQPSHKDGETKPSPSRAKTPDRGKGVRQPQHTATGSNLVCAANVIIRPKKWLWKGHLLRGAQELLTGIPGLGKSQVQINYIACVTTERRWPDGTPSGPPSNVIMMTAEDTLDQEVVPRLIAAGADLKRVQILKSIRTAHKDRQFLLGEDLEELERAVERIGDVGLVTIDPITAYMGGTVDSHKSTEVRSQLGPLKDFAERMDVAVSTITHPPKSASHKAIDHFIGSQAFIAAGRIGHICVEETEEEEEDEGDGDGGGKGRKGRRVQRIPTGRILFANAKNNAHPKMPTLAYRVEAIIIDQNSETGDNIDAPHVVWDEEPVKISADEAVAAAAGVTEGAGPRDSAQTKVRAFLHNILRDGAVAQKKIEEEAAKRGFTDNQLRTAKEKLGIDSAKRGFDGGWVWELPF